MPTSDAARVDLRETDERDRLATDGERDARRVGCGRDDNRGRRAATAAMPPTAHSERVGRAVRTVGPGMVVVGSWCPFG